MEKGDGEKKVFSPSLSVDAASELLLHPESPTDFSRTVMQLLREYTHELFTQEHPPLPVQQFIEKYGIIIPIGSLLRGRMDIYSDLDILPVDAGISIGTEQRKLISKENAGHPSGLSFPEYFQGRLQTLRPDFYGAREAYMIAHPEDKRVNPVYSSQERQLLFDQGHYHVPPDGDPTFLSIDNQVGFYLSTAQLIAGLEALEGITPERLRKLQNLKVPPPIGPYANFELLQDKLTLLPQLLLATKKVVIESREGALRYHQEAVTQAWVHLAEVNPTIHNSLEWYVQSAFDDQVKHISKDRVLSKEEKEYQATFRRGVLKFPNPEELRKKFLPKENVA